MATEKRLIDANALLDFALNRYGGIVIPSDINSFPTVDAVLVDDIKFHYLRIDPDGVPEVKLQFGKTFMVLRTDPVNVREVVHGRWKDNHCTECGMMPMGEELWEHLDCDPPKMEYFMDYCPCCGAQMRDGDWNG